MGFSQIDAALKRLRGLAERPADVRSLAAALPPLLSALSDAATPDGSLMNFERLVQSVADRSHLFRYLAENPRAIEILVKLFVGSQFLTGILLRSPHYLEQLVEYKRVAEFQCGGSCSIRDAPPRPGPRRTKTELNALRRFQQWELLRLSACDAFGLMDLKTVTLQLSLLADSLIQNCLAAAAEDLDRSVGLHGTRVRQTGGRRAQLQFGHRPGVRLRVELRTVLGAGTANHQRIVATDGRRFPVSG